MPETTSTQSTATTQEPSPEGGGYGEDLDVARIIRGANPFVSLSPGQTAMAAGRWAGALVRKPTVLVGEALMWGSEEARVLAGTSKAAPEPKDRRFADPAWSNPVWRRLMQSYLVSRDSLLGSVDQVGLDQKSADRARFALSQITEATAPTNNLLTNPAALKKARKTRGRSLVDGARHRLYDVRHNKGMPSQVDTRPFRVGDTIAVTPGAVVHRTPMYELIQYTPTTTKVRQLPTVIIPPQINRYYFLDLAPGRSFIEHSVAQGLQMFVVSWRNPNPEHRAWGIDEYVTASIEAMRVAAEICESAQVNVIGFCAGGMTTSTALSYLASTHDDLVRSATLAVTLLDCETRSTLNTFASARSVKSSIKKSQRKGVLEGRSLSTVFSWVRPNELVWNYWVANYLMGENPPAFDVLAWNNDATDMPAQLHADFLDLWLSNGLMHPGALTVLGKPVDLQQVKVDMYGVGALTDHLVPWQAAYAATQVFGGETRFVLSNSGHIQALINPPSNPKASFYSGDDNPPEAMVWMERATRSSGSWWTDWIAWVSERSGEQVRKPRSLGNADHRVVEIAPGRYVRE